MLEEFQKIGRDLVLMGLVSSHSGALSKREGNKIFITRMGAKLGDLQAEDIIQTEMEKSSRDSECSLDLNNHRMVYKQSEKCRAIVQANPPAILALSITENKILPQDAEGMHYLGHVSIIKVRDPIGSEEVATLIPSSMTSDTKIFVVKGYASFSFGHSLDEALQYTSILEKSSEIWQFIKLYRGSPVKNEVEKRKAPVHNSSSRSAIPPGIGVMDRSRSNYGGMRRG